MMPVTVIEAMLYGGTLIYCLIGVLYRAWEWLRGNDSSMRCDRLHSGRRNLLSRLQDEDALIGGRAS